MIKFLKKLLWNIDDKELPIIEEKKSNKFGFNYEINICDDRKVLLKRGSLKEFNENVSKLQQNTLAWIKDECLLYWYSHDKQIYRLDFIKIEKS